VSEAIQPPKPAKARRKKGEGPALKERVRKAHLVTLQCEGHWYRVWYAGGEIHFRRVGDHQSKVVSTSIRKVYDLAIGQTTMPFDPAPIPTPTAPTGKDSLPVQDAGFDPDPIPTPTAPAPAPGA
jgi:hypothetical protein